MPAVSSPPSIFPTPKIDVPEPGSKLVYEPIVLRVILDNKLEIYSKLYDWLRNYVNSTTGDQQHDLIITTYNMNENPTKQVIFKDAFPSTIGAWSWSTTDQNDTVIAVDITFNYTEFEIR